MNITRRPLRNAHAAFFAPTGDRVYTSGDYLCGYAIPSLERLFRTRGRITARCVAIRPYGDKLMLAHENGLLDIRDGVTGEIHETLHLRTAIRHFAVSTCGRFGLVSKPSDEIAVFELQSSKQLWWHSKSAKQVEWLETPSSAFAVITSGSQLETWTWPPAEHPRSTIHLPASIYRPVFFGTRVATDSYPAITVKDLSDDTEIFSVPYKAISTPSWLGDGKLFVAREEACELYGADGVLLHKVAAPTFMQFGHAFSPARDDAVLCYLNGIVFVERFQSLLAAGAELPVPFVPRERRAMTSDDVCNYPPEADEQMTVDATTSDELVRALEGFARTAWLPTLVEQRSAATSSKFGGVPWLGSAEPWPRCGQCDSYMNLFLQLNSAELPEEVRGYFDGLLQVFVCTYETAHDGMCESYETFSNAAWVRICRPAGPPAFSELPDPELYDEQRIVEWTRKSDLPDGRELRTLGVTLSDEQEHMQIENIFDFPIEGDKLLGWPAWQQNVESHECPVCHEAMRPIFQIDSCRGVPALLADGGRGWIVQCPKHRDTVALHWTY
jgi:hypothetical protein